MIIIINKYIIDLYIQCHGISPATPGFHRVFTKQQSSGILDIEHSPYYIALGLPQTYEVI